MITDAEIEAERQAFEHFHSLRKYNSSRRERQDAWAAVQRILWRREALSLRAHPIKPSAKWIDFNNTAPAGWTYPGLRSLDTDEVDQMFPGALAAFAAHCVDIPESRFVFDEWSGKTGRLRLSVPMNMRARYTCTMWLPEMRIWRRYSRHISAKPYARIQEVV